MADARPIVLYAGAAVTADGSGAAVDLGELHTLARGSIDVAAVAGPVDPEVVFTFETSKNGTSGWRGVADFGFQEPGPREFILDELYQFVRLSWALNGATSLEFSSNAESHMLYATQRDLRLKELSSTVTDYAPDGVVAEALLSASGDAEDALRAQYNLPISTWPDSLRRRTAACAKYYFFNRDGFAPQGVDELIVKNYDDAQAWFRLVAARRIVLSGVTEPVIEQVRYTFSRDEQEPPRRWSDDFGDF